MLAAKHFLRIFLLALIAAVACVFAGPAMSQDMVLESTNLEQTAPLQDAGLDLNDPLVEDAQLYAEDQGIPLGEAVRRMKLMEAADELTAKLFANERETFAGIWIQHQPQFLIKTRFTRDGERTIQPYIAGGPLKGLVDVLSASASYDELEVAEARARYFVDGLGIPAESAIDESDNLAYVYVTDLANLEAALRTANGSLPKEVELVEVEELSYPTDDIYGGFRLDSRTSAAYCTSGLSVVHSSGATGITTAGHCANAMESRGRAIDYQNDERGNSSGFYGPFDLQWHTTPFVEKPRVRDADGSRVIKDAKGRFEYPEGRVACHYGVGGAAPEYKCGTISNRSYRPASRSYNNPTATFVRVVNNNDDLVDASDSGGPWNFGNTALGIQSGGNTDPGGHAFYMSITYFNDDGPEDFNLVVRKG